MGALTKGDRMPTFTPGPSVLEGPAGGGPLFFRYKLPRGTSVVQRQDGSFYSTRYPSAQELDDAKAHWLGGYTYDIDAVTAGLLIAAGFSGVNTGDQYLDAYTDGYGQ